MVNRRNRSVFHRVVLWHPIAWGPAPCESIFVLHEPARNAPGPILGRP